MRLALLGRWPRSDSRRRSRLCSRRGFLSWRTVANFANGHSWSGCCNHSWPPVRTTPSRRSNSVHLRELYIPAIMKPRKDPWPERRTDLEIDILVCGGGGRSRIPTFLTWKCASRYNGVLFFDISTSKSGPNLVCVLHFDFEMCFGPQRRAIFHVSSGQLAPHPPL